MTSRPDETSPRMTSRSRAKIWIRTALLVIFGGIFGVSLGRDIHSGIYPLVLGAAVLLICLRVRGLKIRHGFLKKQAAA